LHAVFIKGCTEDRLRLIHPRAAEVLEELDAIDNNLIIDTGEGAINRYQDCGWRTGLTVRPDLETAEEAQAASIATRLGDGRMHLIHISGVNQLADGMTKMDTHIDYVGRIVHKRSDFINGRATPIRDQEGKVYYRRTSEDQVTPRRAKRKSSVPQVDNKSETPKGALQA
jgi:hypothetical protein